MPPYLNRLDPTRSAMRSFVAGYYRQGSVDLDTLAWPREHLERKTFDVNQGPFQHSIPQEVRGPCTEAYRLLAQIPLLPILTEPVYTGISQRWSENVVNAALKQSWCGLWDGHVMLHFYRRITPPEYQARAHMQIVYAVIVAFNLQTMNVTWLDDALDSDETRNGFPAWYRQHPESFPPDTNLLMAMGKHILRHVVPDSHPMKQEIMATYDEYSIHCMSCISVTSGRIEKVADKELRDALHYPVDSVTQETHHAFNFSRAGYYLINQREMCRLLACYRDIITPERQCQLYWDHSARTAEILCVMDDLRDTKRFNIQLPRQLALHEYIPHVRSDMMDDFVVGDTHHAFLLASLELARGQSTAVTLTENEQSEIMATLRECYWSKEQGVEEDTAVKDTRTRRLCAMFLKYDIYGYVKKHMLRREIQGYFAVDAETVREINLPLDLLSHAFASMINGEIETRPQHVAAAIDTMMATSEMDEREKLQRLLVIINDI